MGLGTKLMLTIIICIRVAKVGGLSPLTMKSEGARAPPAPPISPPLTIDERDHTLYAYC